MNGQCIPALPPVPLRVVRDDRLEVGGERHEWEKPGNLALDSEDWTRIAQAHPRAMNAVGERRRRRFCTFATFTDVSTGFHHACGLIADGRIYCWGYGGFGQLGGGTLTDAREPQAVRR